MSDPFAYNRRQLLLNLKDSANKLMPHVHNNTFQSLNENNHLANILCDNIEMCLLYGIRITDFYGTIPLWGLLERLEISSTTPLLYRKSITSLSGECHSSLRTPLARARGWIRQALNQKVLDQLLEFIMSSSSSSPASSTSANNSSVSNTINTHATLSPTPTSAKIATAHLPFHLPLLNRFYHNYSIILTPADVNIYIAVIRSLKIFSFAFDLDSPELLLVPLWISHFLQPEKIITTTLAADSRKVSVSSLKDEGNTSVPVESVFTSSPIQSDNSNNNNNNDFEINSNNNELTDVGNNITTTAASTNGRSSSESNRSTVSNTAVSAGNGKGFFSLLQKDIYDTFQVPSAASSSSSSPDDDDDDGDDHNSSAWHNANDTINNNHISSNSKHSMNADTSIINSTYSGEYPEYPKHTKMPLKLHNKHVSKSAYAHSLLDKGTGSDSIKPRLSLYGTSLSDLVLDDTRCPHAFMEPRLGMPKQIFTLINYINKHIDTPGLFRKKGPSEQVKRLRKSLEAELEIPSVMTNASGSSSGARSSSSGASNSSSSSSDASSSSSNGASSSSSGAGSGGGSASTNEMSVHTATYILLEWLNQLPEPLLGYQHYDAIQACFLTLNDDKDSNNSRGTITHTHHHRIRNISLLVNESPWYNQPLLCRLLALLSNCLHPIHIVNNELTLNTLAVLLTPSLFRNKSHNHVVSPYRFISSGGGSNRSYEYNNEYNNEHATIPSHNNSSSSSSSSAGIGASSPTVTSSYGINHRGSSGSSSSHKDMIELNRCLLTSAASGSAVTEFFLLHEAAVLQHVRDHLTEVHSALQTKCVRLRRMQESVNMGVNVVLIYKCVTELLISNGSDHSTNTNAAGNNNNHDDDSSDVSINGLSHHTGYNNNNHHHHQQISLVLNVLSLVQQLWQLLEGVECRRKSIDVPNRNKSSSAETGEGNSYTSSSSNGIRHDGCDSDIHDQFNTRTVYQHKKKSHHHHHMTDSADVTDSSTDGGCIASNHPALQELQSSQWRGSLEALLSSTRWEIAGFTNSVVATTSNNRADADIPVATQQQPQQLIQLHNPFQDFTLCAVTAVDCLVYALTHYEGRVAMIIIEFAQSCKRYCTLGQMAGSICSNIAQVLGLMTISTNMQSEYPPIQYLSRQAHWQLLSDENLFYELFVMLLLSYDDYWKRLTNKAHQLPHSDTHTFCLEYVLTILYSLLSPPSINNNSNNRSSGTTPVVIRSVEKLWEVWTLQRVSQQQVDEEEEEAKKMNDSGTVTASGGIGLVHYFAGKAHNHHHHHHHHHHPNTLQTGGISYDGNSSNNSRHDSSNNNNNYYSGGSNNTDTADTASAIDMKSSSNSTASAIGNNGCHNDTADSSSCCRIQNDVTQCNGDNVGGVVVMGGEENDYQRDMQDAKNATIYCDQSHRTVTTSGSSGYSGSIPVPLLRPSSVLKYEPQPDHSHEADILPVSHHSTHSSPLRPSLHPSTSTRQVPKGFITANIVNTGGNMISEIIADDGHNNNDDEDNHGMNHNVIVVPRMNSLSKSITMCSANSNDINNKINNNNSNTMIKYISGIETTVTGRSLILTQNQLQQIEAGLPRSYQCLDWSLVYRLTRDGASVDTLIRRAAAAKTDASLLVIQDSNKVIFGALITEKIKLENTDKYYGCGTICVWSFVSGVFALYPSTNRNNYFLISADPFGLALGGGGNFALYLDGDLNKGSSGNCDTFNSPCLSSSSPFTCVDCELYKLSSPFA